ncbi:preprotein translocase subunit SecA [Aquipuribacter nitratireducens]|uniref:Protein translocase subunit SecA n=1 Tax=Aquipuribacter nitratireducens TaxID=650104 RepID=A0ABW0GK55_9MICO
MPRVGFIDRMLRVGEGKVLRRLTTIADQVNAIEDEFVAMSDAELRGETDRLKARLADGETLERLMPEAFAAVREASKRTLGFRHFDVQVMGGAALHLGNIAEMKTGEGKTLVATLPAYLNALTGRGVHVVTVNDYLARYQSDLMGRVYRFLGMETGVVLNGQTPTERRQMYAADITYGTNNEFGFDYLRDNMAQSLQNLVQRDHYFAIVDEVDSILVDEARTPLIISGPVEQPQKWYQEFARLAARMEADTHYEVDEKKRTVGVTEDGIALVEDHLGVENLYESENTPLIGFLNNAVKAKELYKRDRDYVVIDGNVNIVDEHTGRMLPGRRYSEGMHQAIEAKEGVTIQRENQTLASITLQNYFRMYNKLAGMTGTAKTEETEFSQIYGMGVVEIPTNRPMVRADEVDVVYKNEDAKYRAILSDIVERHEKGQPVLVGTTSVEKSERVSRALQKAGIPHEVLNAKQHEREAAVVAMAGRTGAVTVATNMAGRGTDIMLGGNAEFMAVEAMRARGLDPNEDPEAYEAAWPDELDTAKAAVAADADKVLEAGGLYVLGTERHESRRIDNQLRGRSGRQGDPGESRFYLALSDDLMRMFNSGLVEGFLERTGVSEDEPIRSKMVSRSIESAQKQVEARNFEIRKNVLKYDDVLNMQRTVIYKERRRVLEHADLGDEVRHFAADVVEGYVRAATSEPHAEDWDLDQLWQDLRAVYPVGVQQEEVLAEHGGLQGVSPQVLVDELTADVRVAYDAREEEMSPALMRQLERRVVLGVIDRKWREHLYEMDYLQDGIGLRAMAQRNPLVEYQREGFDMFQAMTEGIKEETVRLVFAAQLTAAPQRPPAGVEVVDGGGSEPVAVGAGARTAGAAAAGAATGGTAGGAGAPAQPPTGTEPGEPADKTPAAAAEAEPEVPASFSVPGLDQRVGALSYTAPTLDGEAPGEPGTSGARPAGRGGADGANRAQRRAAAKRDKRQG